MKDKSKKSTYSTTFGIDPKIKRLAKFLQVAFKQYIIYILNGAGGGGRTHNLKLGKLALCQLSYARVSLLSFLPYYSLLLLQ